MSIGKMFFRQCINMKDCQNQFSAEDSIEITPYPESGNREQSKADANTDADDAVDKAGSGFAQSVQHTCEGGVQIKERADVCHGLNVDTGSLAVK